MAWENHLLLQILSFLELVLLIITPFVAISMFVSPILVKTISFFFFLPLSLAQKGQLDCYCFFSRIHGNSMKILLRGLAIMELPVKTRMARYVRWQGCVDILSQWLVNISLTAISENTILSITSHRNNIVLKKIKQRQEKGLPCYRNFFPKWSPLDRCLYAWHIPN